MSSSKDQKIQVVNGVLLYSENDMVVKDANHQLFEKETIVISDKLLQSYYSDKTQYCGIDIGAYTGIYSIFWRKYCNLDTIIAFEPNKHVFERLKENIELNKCGKINTLNWAVGSFDGVMQLYSKNFDLTSAASATKLDGYVCSDECSLVSLDTHPDLFQKKIAIMKIDVEGHEKEVLFGAEHLIKENLPIIILETLTQAAEQEYTDLLTSFGYKQFYHKLDGRNMIAYHTGE